MSRDAYVRSALECMRLADQMDDPDSKFKLLVMARAWLKLADYSFAFEDMAQIVSVATQAEAPKEE